MRVRFTLPALADLESIIDYVAQESPAAADQIAKRVAAVAEMICHQPRSGKVTDDPAIRRFNLAPYPYILLYEVREHEILIMAIRHGARDPASMPGFQRNQ